MNVSWWRQLGHTLGRRRQFERELDEELAFHLEARTEQLRADGLSADAAHRQARIELGMLELHRDDVRRARGLALLDGLWLDLRCGWRGLLRSPAYAATAVAVLALPMAAGLLLLALLDAYVWRMPPIDDTTHWVQLSGRSADGWHWSRFTPAEARQLVAAPPPAFRGLYSLDAVMHPLEGDVRGAGLGEAVSDNFFELAGVGARIGRVFSPSTGEHDGVVLSELGWQRLFGGRTDVLGRSLAIGGQSFQVIGVAGRGFSGTMPVPALYWLREDDYRRRIAVGSDAQPLLELSGFVADGVSPAAAADALGGRLAALTADRELPLAAAEVARRPGLMGPDDYAEAQLMALPAALAVLLMLAVAAANLANLVLARFAARRHDVAVRAALGAGRSRLFAGLLVECSLIGLLAVPIAIALAALLLPPLHAYVFGWIARLIGTDLRSLQLSWHAVPLALALAAGAVLCFGVLPAWLVSAPGRLGRGATGALKRAGAGPLRARLMVAQVAASVLLLVVAGLLAGNARRSADTALGFDPAPLVAMRSGADPQALVARVAALPGVEQVAPGSSAPLSLQEPERLAVLVDGVGDSSRVRWIDPQWLAAVGLTPERGHGFGDGSDSRTRYALVSHAAAERWWPGRDPLGRTLRLSSLEPVPGHAELVEQPYQVVGVLPDLASVSLLDGRDPAMVYLPARLGEPVLGELLVRMADPGPAALDALYRACSAVDPAAGCRPRPLADVLLLRRLPLAIASQAAGAIGWIALAISCLGLYGLVSYAVVQRRRELGIRMALGAGVGDQVRLVMRDATRQTLVGLGLGLAAALLAARALGHFIERLQLADPIAFIATPLLLVALALVAAWLPARRTARIDPTEALRAEG